MKTAFRAALACSILHFFCHTTVAQTAADYHNRADAGLQSFLLKFFNGGAQYLKHNYPDNGQLTGYWTYANGWDAVLDGVERTGDQQYGGLIETLYLGQNERGWLVAHYDDEAWMCLALIRAYDLTGRSEYLAKAEELFADIQGGWDTTCCGPNPGGIWWDKAHTQKATAANAGPALAGARLYARTGDPSYLSFATTVYSYWLANMVHSTHVAGCRSHRSEWDNRLVEIHLQRRADDRGQCRDLRSDGQCELPRQCSQLRRLHDQ